MKKFWGQFLHMKSRLRHTEQEQAAVPNKLLEISFRKKEFINRYIHDLSFSCAKYSNEFTMSAIEINCQIVFTNACIECSNSFVLSFWYTILLHEPPVLYRGRIGEESLKI